jgi:hypothetical protein
MQTLGYTLHRTAFKFKVTKYKEAKYHIPTTLLVKPTQALHHDPIHEKKTYPATHNAILLPNPHLHQPHQPTNHPPYAQAQPHRPPPPHLPPHKSPFHIPPGTKRSDHSLRPLPGFRRCISRVHSLAPATKGAGRRCCNDGRGGGGRRRRRRDELGVER